MDIICGYIRYQKIMHFLFQINIGVGLLNSLFWLHWCYKNIAKMPHVKKAAIAVGLLNATVLLELLDFEPIFWTFDSHALWHLATAPIHFIWYQFILDDCEFLYNQAKKDIGKMV